MEAIVFNMYFGQYFIRNFLPCLIPVRVESGTNVEACLRGRIADQVDKTS